jgi:hypothetical protein
MGVLTTSDSHSEGLLWEEETPPMTPKGKVGGKLAKPQEKDLGGFRKHPSPVPPFIKRTQ